MNNLNCVVKHNVLEGIPLANESVDVIVTSPPYYGLRSYGDDNSEIGCDQTLQEYLDDMRRVFTECYRVLKNDGLLWLNIWDTASGSGGAGGDYNHGGKKHGFRKWKQGETGLSKGTWCNVHGRVVNTLVDDVGFLLRSEIVWNKQMERPESLKHVKRVRPQHEMVYCFAKTKNYRWDVDGLVETGTIWSIKPVHKTGFVAAFPEELVARCLLAFGVKPGDIILDPFAGSGTVINVASRFRCDAIGYDLYVV